MAITLSGTSVTIDETIGLQNDTATAGILGDEDDNDILATSLPLIFSTRLTALGAGTAMGAALSGYTGAPGDTGSNAFTITPEPGATITDISFTNSSGAPLNGVDSGLDTLDGTSILLYTDTNNNIVLGRAGGPTGAIVFAAYIEETGSPVTGGKLWTVQYEPLKHPDTGDPDDSLDLSGIVFIGTSQDLVFSLANAPSGQNLFLMFTTANPTVVDDGGVLRITDPTIIATGKDPANQSTGVNITTGDTINTSQAGGPTTFGTNNQMIVEQEGIRFSFVTGARQDVTIPNLDQNEADLESNIDFTDVFNARSASFDVVQLQSGKTAVVRISAFSTDAESGNDFIDGYADDTSVAITNIRVTNISTGAVNEPGIAISIVSGVATITGVKAGYRIEYTTTADHNRVLIENGAAIDAKGNNHADFDIGGFKLRQVTTDTAEIGSKMLFEDDGPSIDANANAVPTLTTDDTEIPDSAGPTSFAGLFTAAFGQDGFKDADDNNVQDADAIAYSLGVSAVGGVDSGLVDTLSGDKIYLFLESGTVIGRVGTAGGAADPAGVVALSIAVVASTGNVTLTQNRSVVHNDPLDPVESGASAAGLAAALVTLTATITDGDGDTDTATRNIGDAFRFEDDGPSIDGNATAVPTLATDDTEIPDSAGPTSFAALFTSIFGQDDFKDSDDDNVQDADAITYALGVSAPGGLDSGLVDTLSGDKIYLFLEGGAVVGRVGTAGDLADPAGAVALSISVVTNTGNATLTQNRSVVHNDPLDPVESGASAAGLAAALVTLTATITDGDGDTDTATRNIGGAFKFEDDGPSIDANATAVPTLTTDDTEIPDSAGPISFAGLFTAPAFGQDDFKDADDNNVQDADAIAYTLGVSAPGGVDSGLVDTLSGNKIYLYLESGAVVGRVGSAGGVANPAGAVAITIAVVANTGNVTLTQNRSVVHNDPLDPVESGASAAGLAAAALVTLTATVTDGDGDTDTATRNIGDAFKFEDDGPALAFGNLIGTGSILPQFGYWDMSAGTDGLGAAGLDIALVNGEFTLVRPDNTTTTGVGTLTEQSPSPDANGAYQFAGTLTGDFDNSAATPNTTIDYTLTAYADGTYALDLVQGFRSTVVRSSADGSLDAGGPDPVRTLTIAPEEIVFFAANPLAPQTGANSIQTGIGLGEPDPTEAQLQTNPLPSYIGTAAMNVSTSGIGIANNNLDGNTTAGINAGDESFVINPESLLTAMKVFIDNSVQGYNPTTEELYYTIYYEDGTTSGSPTKVVAADLSAEAGGQMSFLVEREGTKLIDAVQLTMGKGVVKIPVIQFIQETENLANDVRLAFSATLTDGDGDKATSTFDANLFANEPDDAQFDYTLAGTGGERDAFNIDLSFAENLYQVTGFDVSPGLRDTLVLNGDQNALVQSIDNSGANSIVTIDETGAETTTITVVGVDLLASDIVFGGA